MSELIDLSATDFLRGVYGEEWPGWLVLWRSDTKKSLWINSDETDQIEPLVDRCKNQSKAHLYYGVGLQQGIAPGGERGPDTSRGSAARVVAIPGLWLDLDTMEGASTKRSRKNYPPLSVALQAISEMPIAPSMAVNSGGGLHVYWLFRELLPTYDDTGDSRELRTRANTLTTGWERVMEARLRAAGNYELDHVSDLARVLRPVGSWNWSHARSVEILAAYRQVDSWVRYDPEDFEQYLPEPTAQSNQAQAQVLTIGEDGSILATQEGLGSIGDVTGTTGPIVADAAANAPLGKLQALLDNCTEFQDGWGGGGRFASNSERELSLANYAVQADWSDQEIANLIIEHRRRSEPEKLAKVLRLDYLTRTIGMARGTRVRALADQSMTVPIDLPASDLADELREAGELAHATAAAPAGGQPPASSAERRRQHLDALSHSLGIRVDGWIQLGLENPIYVLVYDGGKRMQIGSARDVVHSDSVMRQVIYSHTGVCLQPTKPFVWRGTCERLAAIRELHLAESSENMAAMREQIERYFGQCDFPPKGHAMLRGAAFIDGGKVWLSMATLLRWVNQFGGERWQRRWLYATIRELGFVEELVQSRVDGRKIGKRYWGADARFWATSLPDVPGVPVISDAADAE